MRRRCAKFARGCVPDLSVLFGVWGIRARLRLDKKRMRDLGGVPSVSKGFGGRYLDDCALTVREQVASSANRLAGCVYAGWGERKPMRT